VVSEPDSRTGTVLLDDLRDVVNWEVTLRRDLADRGIRPPIDLRRSGTRREERLFNDSEEVARRAHWRATLTGDPVEDSTALIAYCAANGTHHKVGTDDA
jgi:transcription termination factor Rho